MALADTKSSIIHVFLCSVLGKPVQIGQGSYARKFIESCVNKHAQHTLQFNLVVEGGVASKPGSGNQ